MSDEYEFEIPKEILPWIEHQRETNPDFPLDCFILENGQPTKVHWMKWAMWFENLDNRRVDYTKVGSGYVSTVFLGIPHIGRGCTFNFLYETMIFDTATECDGRQWHYRTLAEAKQGHWQAVDLVKQELG